MQAWGGYNVDKKGKITVFPGEVGETSPYCLTVHANETHADVTERAAGALSGG
jgi:hypothetical protein